jgi:DNA-binding PadR family transcriptional regulator
MTASEIIDYLEDQFKGLWVPKAGTIYPILNKLENRELIESIDKYPKIYYLTINGKKQINFLASIFNNEIQFFQKFAKFVSGAMPRFSILDKILPKKLEDYRDWLIKELDRVEKLLRQSKHSDDLNDKNNLNDLNDLDDLNDFKTKNENEEFEIPIKEDKEVK